MTKENKDDFNLGEDEENVYSEDVREDLVESGEISAEEEGFMAGYDEADEKNEKEEKDSKDEDEKKKDDEDNENVPE